MIVNLGVKPFYTKSEPQRSKSTHEGAQRFILQVTIHIYSYLMADHNFFGVNSIGIPGLNKVQPIRLPTQVNLHLVTDRTR